MKPRFRIRFESPAVSSLITDKHPDLIPIIDTDTHFAFGRVIALCPDMASAETLVELLNKNNEIETIKKVLGAANEVGPLPEWTRTEDGAEDVLRQIQQESIDA